MQLARTGEAIGGYRLLHRIGSGGMGVVYAAEHLLLGRRAAIKFLRPEVTSHPQMVERFFNEARAASAIKHPGIVEVYDFGYHDGLAFLVMEHLEGESLLERLRRLRRLPVSQAIPIAIQIASALDAAHAAGVIHRDLKPDNIFLVQTTGTDLTRSSDALSAERVCILDFGVAKLLRGDGGWSATATATDVVVGTPTFMSPEQCRGGGQVDGRSDLYSLGCILYGMLCGRPPFIGEGGGDVLAQHIMVAPQPPSMYAIDTPVALESIIMRLLEKDPARRFQSAPDTVRALREAVEARDAGVTPAPLPRAGTAPPIAMLSPSPMPLAPTLEPSALLQAPAPQRSRAPLVWAAVGVVAALALAIPLFTGGDDDRAGAPAQPAATRPSTASAAATSQVELVIESVPVGADVLRVPGGERLGRTPYRIRRPPQEGYVQFELRREGYEAETISLRADVGVETQVVLRRLEVPAPPAAAATTPATRKSGSKSSRSSSSSSSKARPASRPAPVIGDGALDPFSR
ncbi:MAG TPA: protein kinase [Kofleriaceae bacterium]|nr:protein kinase [Kofleriaceae bacterium]